MKNARAARGCRPSSARMAPVSVYDVRQPIEQGAQTRQVVGVEAEMRRDEPRPRVPCEQPVALGHQRVERRVGGRRAAPIRMHLQLEPALVVLVHGLEEGRRLAGVNQDGNADSRAGLEHLVEFRVVHSHTAAIGACQREAEVLEDLQPLRPGAQVGLEAHGRAVPVARLVQVAEVQVGELHHPGRRGAGGNHREVLPQLRAGPAAQVDEDAQVQRVHLPHDRGPVRRGDVGTGGCGCR